jgi:hypothetical protein
MPQGGQGLGTSSSRTRTVDQGSALYPACACPTHPERQDDQSALYNRPPDRTTDQPFRWSAYVWSPPPESNRRPHPYHGTTRNRCAKRRFPRSRPTVGAKVIGALSAKLCAFFQPWVRRAARSGARPRCGGRRSRSRASPRPRPGRRRPTGPWPPPAHRTRRSRRSRWRHGSPASSSYTGSTSPVSTTSGDPARRRP